MGGDPRPGKVICNDTPGLMVTLCDHMSLSTLRFSLDSHSALSSVKMISVDNKNV